MITILRRIRGGLTWFNSSSGRLEGIKLGKQMRFKSERTPQDRVERINSRLPRFLQRYTSRLRSAPLTHITSFLILHELTAIIPLLGLAATFHYTQWMPPYISEWKYASDGIEKFGNYFRRKGWLGSEDAKRAKAWGWGEGGVRVVVEFATAYAVTKVLLPVRLIASVSATPWFARVAVVPCLGVVKRMFGMGGARAGSTSATAGLGSAKALSPAGGTNAVGGGVVGK